MLLVRRAVIIEHLLARIDGRVVRLIVDHQQWKLSHQLTTITRAGAVSHTRLNPVQQSRKNSLLLLDDKKPWPLFR